jgi:hypothetical protein
MPAVVWLVDQLLRFFEPARVLVRFDYVAAIIINADHSIMRAAIRLGKADGIADCIWPGISQGTVWQHIAN